MKEVKATTKNQDTYVIPPYNELFSDSDDDEPEKRPNVPKIPDVDDEENELISEKSETSSDRRNLIEEVSGFFLDYLSKHSIDKLDDNTIKLTNILNMLSESTTNEIQRHKEIQKKELQALRKTFLNNKSSHKPSTMTERLHSETTHRTNNKSEQGSFPSSIHLDPTTSIGNVSFQPEKDLGGDYNKNGETNPLRLNPSHNNITTSNNIPFQSNILQSKNVSSQGGNPGDNDEGDSSSSSSSDDQNNLPILSNNNSPNKSSKKKKHMSSKRALKSIRKALLGTKGTYADSESSSDSSTDSFSDKKFEKKATALATDMIKNAARTGFPKFRLDNNPKLTRLKFMYFIEDLQNLLDMFHQTKPILRHYPDVTEPALKHSYATKSLFTFINSYSSSEIKRIIKPTYGDGLQAIKLLQARCARVTPQDTIRIEEVFNSTRIELNETATQYIKRFRDARLLAKSVGMEIQRTKLIDKFLMSMRHNQRYRLTVMQLQNQRRNEDLTPDYNVARLTMTEVESYL